MQSLSAQLTAPLHSYTQLRDLAVLIIMYKYLTLIWGLVYLPVLIIMYKHLTL